MTQQPIIVSDIPLLPVGLATMAVDVHEIPLYQSLSSGPVPITTNELSKLRIIIKQIRAAFLLFKSFNIAMTIRLFLGFAIVILMISFGWPKS